MKNLNSVSDKFNWLVSKWSEYPNTKECLIEFIEKYISYDSKKIWNIGSVYFNPNNLICYPVGRLLDCKDSLVNMLFLLSVVLEDGSSFAVVESIYDTLEDLGDTYIGIAFLFKSKGDFKLKTESVPNYYKTKGSYNIQKYMNEICEDVNFLSKFKKGMLQIPLKFLDGTDVLLTSICCILAAVGYKEEVGMVVSIVSEDDGEYFLNLKRSDM